MSEPVPAPTSSEQFNYGQDILHPGSLEGGPSMGCYWLIHIEDPEIDQVRDIHEICGPI